MQRVALADEVLSGHAEGRLDVQRERAQAPATGALEDGQLQDVFVQMRGDVGAQLVGEVVQQLRVSVFLLAPPTSVKRS